MQHPIGWSYYTSNWIIQLLLSFGMMAEWATLPRLILYPVMIGMYVRLAKREETDMLVKFGDEYREYMKATKKFIPFIM